MAIKLIGDVHGKYDEYYRIASKSKYTVQLGDFGFSSAWNKLGYSDLNPVNHMIIPGNHDCYDCIVNSPYYRGDFGMTEVGGTPFFFIRGGLSIDRVYRVGEELGGSPKTWWSQEELNFAQMLKCAEEYAKAKPDIALSHAPPGIICDRMHGNKHGILQKFKFHVGFQENTSLLGNHLLSIHRPKLWFFGHHHISYSETVDGTEFRCLAELESYELNI